MTPPPEPVGPDRHEPERSGAGPSAPGRSASKARAPQDGPPGSADSAPSGSAAASSEREKAKDAEGRGTLTRSPRQKVLGGVCGGLGRYCDVDPVVFRIVVGVLSVAGGLGMIFYGFAWLLIPMEGEEENEGRKLLSGRVEGAALIAVLLALIGCGLFLSMLGNGGTLSFAVMLTCAVVASGVYAKHRREAAAAGGPPDPAAAYTVPDAPPETKAPPVPGGPSWWRDPIVKDGTTGHYAATYLWGPEDEPSTERRGSTRMRRVRRAGPSAWAYGTEGAAAADLVVEAQRPADIGGSIFFAALVAGGLGTWLSWHAHPLGVTLQIGLALALAVLGAGLILTSFVFRAGFGTIFLTIVTTLLLAAATALPSDISTHWSRATWRPANTAAVAPSYRLGSGVGTLDLRGLKVAAGTTVRTSAHVGGGRLKVLVPAGTALDIRAGTTAGAVRLPGDSSDELHIAPNQTLHRTYSAVPAHGAHAPRAATRTGTLALRLDVGLGEVEVTRAAS
ncbi:PspC domain-containing protein [Streptomyces sp. DW26H14]|uniref:PspC domain-containing protein n=1 Tax=Streptomyces sp. DW26H14 TaxID=3435395 RepID=UPI00403DECB5